MKRTLFQSVLLVVLICSIPVRGQIPQTLSYQGVLTDANGVIVPDGKYTLTFKLFDADEGGKAIWSENQKIFIQNGLFNVALGSCQSSRHSFRQTILACDRSRRGF